MGPTRRSGRWLAAAAGLVLGGAAAAAGLRLPADYIFPQGDGSPGAVTFSHATHVDGRSPACVACHPTRFAMLRAGTATGLPALRHQDMEKGQACGACHGKQAFGFDSCEMCHK
jgi:c(7)-type cytochrome triheme protein